jgi:N-acetylglucosaminyldiphosphoundecaprenol N-acetyl-beta-D-mannosaminyltransferase
VSLTTFFEMSSQKKLSKPFRAQQRYAIAGVPVNCITIEDASTQIIDVLRKRSATAPFLIMGPNAHLVTVAQKDFRLLEALNASALNVPDGISVLLASRILGGRIPARVPGGELMEYLCRDAARYGLRAFFLGGLPEAATLASLQIQRRYPALSIAGTYCPPRGFDRDPMECAHIRQLITEAAPDLLFVAFGVPRQEIWMHENCPTLPIGAAMSVGAAFDTQSGLRKRAPRWTHKLGMEWLYRLLKEPRRLWSRYLIGNPHFFYLVLRQRFLYGRSAARDKALPFPRPDLKPTPDLPPPKTACESAKDRSASIALPHQKKRTHA